MDYSALMADDSPQRISFRPLWSEPPPAKSTANMRLDKAFDAFMAVLKDAPGRWAELSSLEEDGAHPMMRATYLRKNYADIEVTTRATTVKNRVRIWVRYQPKPVPDVLGDSK